MKRRAFLLGSMVAVSGCSSLAVRSQSPEDELDAAGENVRLVGDVAVPFGFDPISIESIGLVTGLPGTGSDPPPSPQRSALISEMITRGVMNPKPEQLLASPSTEMVMVRALLRPGIQKGDHFDIEVRTLARSECTSLRDGWLMEARLREMAVLGGEVREGSLLGIAQGAVLVDPSAKADDRVANCRGRILGGGVSMTSRELGLVLKNDERSVLISAQIGNAINKRFHTYEGGLKTGVAKPKTDEFVTLRVHPRYKDNLERYIRVVRALPLRESAQEQMARTQLLERQLLDPITSSTAAVRLEALGKESVPALKKGLGSKDNEVRFYSAEALAYLDEHSSAAVLGELARDVPAFRAYALTALSAMDDYSAYEALRELLKVSSAETRYGAFRALWAINSRDPLVKGERLGDPAFNYHILRVEGPPMIHATRTFRPEIVLFGAEQRLKTPIVLDAGKKLILTAHEAHSDQVTISRFAVNQPDQKRQVSNRIDECIRAIVDLGGTYPDVVQILQQAKAAGALPGRFEVDALPQGGRTYYRQSLDDESVTQETSEIVVANPLPSLFSRPLAERTPSKIAENASSDEKNSAEEAKSPGPMKAFFGKIFR